MNSFFKRLLAYIIDLMIISIVCSFFSVILIDNSKISKLVDEAGSTYQNYLEEKIDDEAFVGRVEDIGYDIVKSGSLYSIVSIGIYMLYFAVYQFKHKGQTIGKRLLKIKIIGVDGDLTMNQLIFRSFIIDSILFNLLNVMCLLFLPKDIYLLFNSTLIIIQYLVLFICVVMVMFKKDHMGLHDMVAHTKVVNI